MEEAFQHLPGLLRLTLQASVLIVLVLAAQWCLGARLQPRWRFVLWLLVVLRLALPWTVPSPASVFNVMKLPAIPEPPRANAAPVEELPQPLPVALPRATTMTTATRWVRTHTWFWLWLTGAILVAGTAVVYHIRIHLRVARRRPLIEESTLNLLEDCKALMGVSAPIALVETGAVATPTLFGFIRPRILLPAGLSSSFTREELRHVFLHELAHIKRHDVLIGWLMMGLQTIHWFNPLVWLAFYHMRAERELACDALALSYADPGENESYGLTVVKLLERFGKSVWAPSLAGILETQQRMKERIIMIANFRKTNRGLALAVCLVAALALATLTDAQNRAKPAPAAGYTMQLAQKGETGAPGWSLQEKLDLAAAGNHWAVYDLWDAYYRGKHGIQPDPTEANKWLQQLVQNLWVVRFEPTGDFAPASPGEFLSRINKYSQCRSGRTQIGAASFFRTTQHGNKLLGAFLSNYPDQLKTCLAKVPGVTVTGSEQVTPEFFLQYERSPQESLWALEQKIKAADAGNKWAVYDLWDAYYRGNHGVERDPVLAERRLKEFTQGLWVVRFEPVDDFAPRNPGEFLKRIDRDASVRSGANEIGMSGFFRTTKQGDRLLGSFLSNYPDQLKAKLANVAGLKVTSAEPISPQDFIKYEESPQESL